MPTLMQDDEVLSPAWVDMLRLEATGRLPQRQRSSLGQFLTPGPVAQLMASFFGPFPSELRLLDPGAGVGSLTAAVVVSFAKAKRRPRTVKVVAYEVDPLLCDYLRLVLGSCWRYCAALGIAFESEIREMDFIEDSVRALRADLFAVPSEKYSHVITNPPYKKINALSRERRLLTKAGIETSNLYSAFVFLAASQLERGGELVAITPRSFCNGPYFRPFRRFLVDEFAFRRCHVFDSRDRAFGDDEVLQENVIFSAAKGAKKNPVLVSSSEHPGDEALAIREVDHGEFVDPSDPELFFRLATDENEKRIGDLFAKFQASLEDLGLVVSTGRVVDFRATRLLRKLPGKGTVPLLYPVHMSNGGIAWPAPDFKKFNAIMDSKESRPLLIPMATYVVTKRFSAKEETRRVVASLLTWRECPGARVGIENHLNYFHADGAGIDEDLARGLCLFLNSSLLDRYFRQFSGHTQVNATDLRSIRYPDSDALQNAGRRARRVKNLDQEKIDAIAEEELFKMTPQSRKSPRVSSQRIGEALEALKDLGLPREQQNERSALTLLALLDLTPRTPWSGAQNPLCGITQMMTFFEKHYGKKYAPNTRETVRRQTMHQFVQAGLAVENPDAPSRPTNSPKWCYQVPIEVLAVLRVYGTKEWRVSVKRLLADLISLRVRYSNERDMLQIPVKLAPGKRISLSPGGQNTLIKEIVEGFCPRFTPGCSVLYVGDSAAKWGYFDEQLLKSLGMEMEQHGKMPDVVVFVKDRNWLVLIEAVTSHGPVNPKRHIELKHLFKDSKAGLVFVTAFPDRKTLLRYINEIAWETDVWCADNATHLIHFNGERFLGPHK